MIGCAESHRRVLIEGLFDGTPYVGVFEDDAVQCVPKVTIEEWIKNDVPEDWDILCLGTNKHVKPILPINEHTVQLKQFWGTHAMIIKRETITKLLGMYEQLQLQGIQPIADWWYNAAIAQYNLRCYAPSNPKEFFVQQVGFISAITGEVRL
jgi:GR25 family glycosyltransferase involved in LPS biosynthesis